MINLKKKFLIYGYGISGKSIENYFINKNCNYRIYDDYKKIKNKKSISKSSLLKNISQYKYFVVSPSIKISKNHFLFKYKKQILIDLDFLSLEITHQKLIGVTGTEGKSSICNYINNLLSKKYNTKIIGNYGNTILNKNNLQNYLSKLDFIIIELSSYQLEKLKFLKLHYALITNIYSDHLNYHNNQKNYVISKFRIQKLLYSNSNLYLPIHLYFEYKSYIKLNKNRLILNDNKTIYNNDLTKYFQNLNLSSIRKLIKNIDSNLNLKINTNKNELNFRNQLIYKSKNLKIYNDSKCTNLFNAIYKNNLINNSKKILILGGKLKKQQNLKFDISNTMVLIFGKYSDLFLEHLNFINSKYYLFANLKDLISFLKLIIKAYKYDYILFSPGGESFDSYKDYSDRGYSFNKLIKKIL